MIKQNLPRRNSAPITTICRDKLVRYRTTRAKGDLATHTNYAGKFIYAASDREIKEISYSSMLEESEEEIEKSSMSETSYHSSPNPTTRRVMITTKNHFQD